MSEPSSADSSSQAPAGEPRANGFDAGQLPPQLRRLLLISVVVVLAFVVIFVWGDAGLGDLRRVDSQAQAVEQEIEQLRNDNERLERQIEELQRQGFQVERIAREELGLARPGEVVLMLPAEPAASEEGPDRSGPPSDTTDE